MFASLLTCHAVRDFSPTPPTHPTEQDGTQALIKKKRILKKVASELRNSSCLVCRRGLIFVGSPWLWCCLSKPVGPSRLQGDMVKVKGTLRVRSEGIRDALWCLTKTHMNRLGDLLTETVTESITVMFRRPSVEHLKASGGLGTLWEHILMVTQNMGLLRVPWFDAEITAGVKKLWKQA